MEHIGIDVHRSESQICILTEEGEILELRVQTRHERLQAVLGARHPARILIEASTESEWVARFLEGLGHEVIVADHNFAPMYATRSRRIKTDRRDAQALMDACRLGAYRRTHRPSDVQRRVRAELVVRDALVRTSTTSARARETRAQLKGIGDVLAKLNRRLDGPLSWEFKRQLVETLVESVRVETVGEGSERDSRVTATYHFSAPDTPIATHTADRFVSSAFRTAVDDNSCYSMVKPDTSTGTGCSRDTLSTCMNAAAAGISA